MPELDNLVLRFGKALTQEPSILENMPECPAPLWIALGYLDTLQVYPLPHSEEHWLSRAYQSNLEDTIHSDGRFYFHPIHISPGSAQSGADVDFLKIPSPYLFVTLLQGSPDSHDSENLKSQVEDYLIQKLGDQSKAPHPLHFCIYHSITLSDLVVLWKCDSICTILDAVQYLYCAPMVGDSHSIPTILAASIRGEAGAPKIQKEELPLVTNRYVVRSARLAHSFFQKLPDSLSSGQTWFTTGIEDLTRVQEHWTTLDLCNMLRHRLEDADYQKRFQEAFLSCETHLGTPMLAMKDPPSWDVTPLTQYCQHLMKTYQALVKDRDWRDELEAPWLKTTGELFNALLDLSRNTVADGFCYLMLDAVSLFCEKLKHWHGKAMSSQGLQGVQRFLRGWESLMDKVLRTDGRFSQQPGFSPSLCDIPSSLLEFYLVFTTYAGQVMQMDSLNQYRFSLLLVPKLCRRIKVETVFDEDPPCDRLLYVDIPFAMLYQPLPVLCHLTHEISHFSGDEWRLRGLRAKQYLAICAQELAAELMIDRSETVERIRRDISTPELEQLEYLDMLEQRTIQCIDKLLSDTSVVTSWMNAEFQNYAPGLWGDPLQCQLKLQELTNALRHRPQRPQALFFEIMREFKYLFKECYADETAIFTLNLNPLEYLQLIDRETQLFQRSYQKGPSYYLNVERWTIVLHVCFSNQLQKVFAHPPKGLEDFVNDIRQCYHFFYTNEKLTESDYIELTTNYHRLESIQLLTQYLHRCYKQMQSSTDKVQLEALKELRLAFRALAMDGLDISAPPCSTLVSRYRGNALQVKSQG